MELPLLLVLLLVVCVCGSGDWQHRARDYQWRGPKVDLEARKEHYRQITRAGCPPPAPVDPETLPKMPKSFITDLEISFQNGSGGMDFFGQEMYDSSSLRGVNNYALVEGVVLTRPLLLAESMHYTILKDEALIITTDADCTITGEEDCNRLKYCVAGTITDMGAALQELFGIVDMSGGGEFLGAAGLLQFGSMFNYTQKATQRCRGLDCHVYTTCMEKPEEEATLLYTYYWSTPEWNMQNNKEQVPIAVEIFGHGEWGGQITREVMMHIEFFDFRREWMPSRYELEPPVDVYCHGRLSLKIPPKAVSMFSYKSEHVSGFNIYLPDGENQTIPIHMKGVFAQQEWYDDEMRVTRKDYLPFFIFGTAKRFENYTMKIHEFNQGLSYHIRPRVNFCRIGIIENITNWGDVVVGPDGSVHISSPWNFEDMDEELQYNGRHWERGMQADVWVGIKKNPVLKLNETYVWYFASPFTNENLGFKDSIPIIPSFDNVPIKLEKYLSIAEGLPHVQYNIYGYDSKIPTTHQHDISICFGSNDMRHFKFDMPVNSLNDSLYLRENLKYAIMESLMDAAEISPLRINRLTVKQTSWAVEVVFTLLEKPELVGDVPGSQFENSMSKAESLIRQAIDNSQLVVLVKMGNNELSPDGIRRKVTINKLVAMPGTMASVSRDDGKVRGTTNYSGFSPGDMAGLAFGMLALGGILGFAALYFTSKR